MRTRYLPIPRPTGFIRAMTETALRRPCRIITPGSGATRCSSCSTRSGSRANAGRRQLGAHARRGAVSLAGGKRWPEARRDSNSSFCITSSAASIAARRGGIAAAKLYMNGAAETRTAATASRRITRLGAAHSRPSEKAPGLGRLSRSRPPVRAGRARRHRLPGSPAARPDDATARRNAAEYGYTNGDIQGGAGYLRVQVSPAQARVEYVRSSLSTIDEIAP